MGKEEVKQIGQILIELSFITPLQLEHALKVQQTVEKHRQLGQILIDLGYITEAKLIAALVVQKKSKTSKSKVSK